MRFEAGKGARARSMIDDASPILSKDRVMMTPNSYAGMIRIRFNGSERCVLLSASALPVGGYVAVGPRPPFRGCLKDWQGSGAVVRVRYLRSEEHTSELQSRGQLVCRL